MGKPIYGDTVGGGGGSLKKIPQSDWNQTDETQLDYIKNKPDIDSLVTDIELNNKIVQTTGYGADKVMSQKAVTEELDQRTEEAKFSFSNALKGSAAGKTISISDISPVEHDMNVLVRSDNYLNLAKIQPISSNNDIITVENDSIKIFNSNGVYGFKFNPTDIGMSVGETYTLSVEKVTDANDNLINFPTEYGWRYWYGDNSYSSFSRELTCGITLTQDIKGILFYVGSPSPTLHEVIITNAQVKKGATNTDYTPIDYTPFVDISKVKLFEMGKNLFNIEKVKPVGSTIEKIKIDGDVITVSPITDPQDAMYGFTIKEGFGFVIGETYTLSIEDISSHSSDWGWLVKYTDGTYNSSKNVLSRNNILTFIVEKPISQIYFYVGRPYNLETLPREVSISKPQLKLGSTADKYEKYKESIEYTVNADGTVNNVLSIYPTTTLLTDTTGAIIDVEYNRDLNKAFAEVVKRIVTLESAIISQ